MASRSVEEPLLKAGRFRLGLGRELRVRERRRHHFRLFLGPAESAQHPRSAESVDENRRVAARAVIDPAGLALGKNEDEEHELFQCQARLRNGFPKDLEGREEPLAPHQARKGDAWVGIGLLGKDLQHAAEARRGRGLLARASGS